MPKQPIKDETRSMDQLRAHYEIEKELANKLRNASRADRRHLYSSSYNELYRRVPLHPQLTRKSSPRESDIAVSAQLNFIKPFLMKNVVFLEVGPGDCALSYAVSKFVKQVYAVDVSNEITKTSSHPTNFQLLISDGSSIPLEPQVADVAYSNQLMEHLHPDDALEQLTSIYRCLNQGGIYICITPNRLSGPHDVSRYFDDVATGFHLKEYTTKELAKLFKEAGFSRVQAYIGGRGKYLKFPLFLIERLEELLNLLPNHIRRNIMKLLPLKVFLGVRLIGTK